jgi:hypothetical protein
MKTTKSKRRIPVLLSILCACLVTAFLGGGAEGPHVTAYEGGYYPYARLANASVRRHKIGDVPVRLIFFLRLQKASRQMSAPTRDSHTEKKSESHNGLFAGRCGRICNPAERLCRRLLRQQQNLFARREI